MMELLAQSVLQFAIQVITVLQELSNKFHALQALIEPITMVETLTIAASVQLVLIVLPRDIPHQLLVQLVTSVQKAA